MKISPADAEDLRALGVSSLLDLALVLPRGFEDLSEAASPREGECSVRITTRAQRFGRVLLVSAWCDTWECPVSVSIFNARAWHKGAFGSGKTLLIHGKASFYAGGWQFTNPKIIKEFSGLVPHYKTALKDPRVRALSAKYLSLDALRAEGLTDEEAGTLLALHAGDERAASMISNLNIARALGDASLDAENLGGEGAKILRVLKFVEIYNYIKKLSAKKINFPAEKITANDLEGWFAELPFKPTGDQIAALADIRADLASEVASRRVVMGDVGSGKTLVMLGAAAMIYPRVAILMAPTSVLAGQIYEQAKLLLPPYMRVALVRKGGKIESEDNSNLNSEETENLVCGVGQCREVRGLDRPESGANAPRGGLGVESLGRKGGLGSPAKPDLRNVNLIIGTHVLLYRDLPRSPLVMIDEQHRFGSEQRRKIEELASGGYSNLISQDGKAALCDGGADAPRGSSKETVRSGVQTEFSGSNLNIRPHFLQFSATPIPRTLSLIQSNFVNFSFLREMPYEKNIHTIILQNSGFAALLAHLKEQINRGKQAIVVYPLVEESEAIAYQSLSEAAPFWQERFERVFVTHGRDKDKEETLARFAAEGDLLLATTIVEVGISLPRLTTIVIVGGERLGLATLHQLRGRVGRNGGEGWCYVYTKLKTPPARLREFAATLDGFEVANIDLKNRQAGDILGGAFQHGATFEYYEMEEEIAKEAKSRLALFKFETQNSR